MIGDPISRVDGPLKVTGAARYSAEWPLDRLAYGVIVQSTIAHGTIAAIDTASAASLPGVLAVMTADNASALPQQGRAGVNPPSGRVLSLLQDREVRYNGEPIAVVVAETFEQATHAASLVRATYRAEPSVVEMKKGLPLAQPYTEKILGQFEPATHRGDVPSARSPTASATARPGHEAGSSRPSAELLGALRCLLLALHDLDVEEAARLGRGLVAHERQR